MVKQWKPLRSLYHSSQSKNLNFFEFSRVSPGAYPLTKKPEDSEYEIAPFANLTNEVREKALDGVGLYIEQDSVL